MLYVVYDDGIIVYTSQDSQMAQYYAKDRASVVGSQVVYAEYAFAYSEEVAPDDD